jgi:transketolase C-terminal domain/subunit
VLPPLHRPHAACFRLRAVRAQQVVEAGDDVTGALLPVLAHGLHQQHALTAADELPQETLDAALLHAQDLVVKQGQTLLE